MSSRYVFVSVILVLALLVPQRVFAAGQMWGNDVLVHQANHIYGFGMDQGDKDTLFLVVSDSSTTNLADTLYVYRSTDNGQSWDFIFESTGGGSVRFSKADIIAAKGDSDFVFIFYIYDKQSYCLKYSYDLSEFLFPKKVSGLDENVVDFAVCQDIYTNYWLYVVYQTDQDSVIFKRSMDFGNSWEQRVNLTAATSGILRSKPSIAWSRGSYLVVAGKSADNKIYTIRNTNYGSSANWQDGQYPSGLGDCDNPVVAGSHVASDDSAIFWVFYGRLVTSPAPHYILNFHWSTDAGATWSSMTAPNDTTSSGNRYLPSLHVLKELGASNITLAYRYEYGVDPRQVRYIYKVDAQAIPSVWNAAYTGINDYSPHHTPPHRAYTIRRTDDVVSAAILYVNWLTDDLYFDASSFTGVEDETEYQAIKGFALGQNYPNPFNSSTTIEYSLEGDGKVQIAVYNILGQKIKTLLDGHEYKGDHRITWDGSDNNSNPVPSGVYFYKIKSEQKTETRKMVLVK